MAEAATIRVPSQAERQAQIARETEQSNARIMSAIRGAVKAVTTDLPGFVLDVVDKISGSTKTLGENDRSEQMFSAITGTKKQDEVAELVGGFVNPVTAVKAMIVPAALLKSSKTMQEANRALLAGESAVEVEKATGIFQLPPNIDDGVLRTIIDSRGARFKNTSEGTRPLEDVWHFPELYAAIPAIRRTPVTFDYNIDGAYMTPWDNNSITIGNVGTLADIKEVTAHETQHVIQHLFRMNTGTAPEAYITDYGFGAGRIKAFQDQVNNLYTEATIAGSFDLGAELIPIDKMLRSLVRGADTNYLRTAGEVEARAAGLIREAQSGPLRPGLEYYKMALPDRDLSKLIQNPGEVKVDSGVDWDKLVDTLAEISQKIEVEKSR